MSAQTIDPAPSGVELNTLSSDGKTIIEQPGKDARVSDEVSNGRETIDFDVDRETGRADMDHTTIEHVEPEHETPEHVEPEHETPEHDETADHADHESSDHDSEHD